MNVNQIHSLLNELISDLVGTRLSQQRGSDDGSVTFPTVLKARQRNPKPQMPYIVTDYMSSDKRGYGITNFGYVSDDNLQYQSDTFYYLPFYIHVHDSVNEDSYGIALELKDRLFLDVARSRFATTNGEVGLLNCSDVTFNSAVIQTDYEEVSAFNVTLSIRRSVLEDVPEVIQVDIEGDIDSETLNINYTKSES